MTHSEMIRAHRKEILDAARRHGASDVRLFGSVVHGRDQPQSDIDLLVKFRDDASLFDHARLVVELERMLKCRVDVASEDALRPQVRRRIVSEAIPL